MCYNPYCLFLSFGHCIINIFVFFSVDNYIVNKLIFLSFGHCIVNILTCQYICIFVVCSLYCQYTCILYFCILVIILSLYLYFCLISFISQSPSHFSSLSLSKLYVISHSVCFQICSLILVQSFFVYLFNNFHDLSGFPLLSTYRQLCTFLIIKQQVS